MIEVAWLALIVHSRSVSFGSSVSTDPDCLDYLDIGNLACSRGMPTSLTRVFGPPEPVSLGSSGSRLVVVGGAEVVGCLDVAKSEGGTLSY